jgi:hypothetical protein
VRKKLTERRVAGYFVPVVEYDEYDELGFEPEPEQEDQWEKRAVDVLGEFFEKNKSRVFYYRQIEVSHEDSFFHWVTNRALHRIIGGTVRTESSNLASGTTINFAWHKSLRYYRREQKKLVKLVEQYSDSNVGAHLGLNGELIVLEGFARNQFLVVGRHTNSYRGKTWPDGKSNLDFIFEKDSVAYGMEVKNQLRYPDYEEMQTKIKMCQFLRVRPVFVVRMMPKVWVQELAKVGGFALILKYQLYPISHKAIARRVASELRLPVDTPSQLKDETMGRFVAWHRKQV